MQKIILQDKYPVYSLTLNKSKHPQKSNQAIIDFLVQEIEIHPVAKLISIFDHRQQTEQIPEHEISTEIINAHLVIFCFGKKLANPLLLAVKPRTISVVETPQNFILSFLESPNPIFNQTMQNWIKTLQD